MIPLTIRPLNNSTLMRKTTMYRALPVPILLWVLVFLLPTPSLGGGLMGFNSTNRVGTAADSTSVQTLIREQVAVTTTTQVFTVPSGDSTMAIYGFALPEAATVTRFRWRIDDQWFVASVSASDTTLPAGGGTATIDVFSRLFGATPFTFPFREPLASGNSVAVELTYVELLPYGRGRIRYDYPVRCGAGMTSIPVNSFEVNIRSARELNDVVASGALFSQVDASDTTMVLESGSCFVNTSGVSAEFSVTYDGLTMSVLSTKPQDEDGYALMMAVPQSNVDDAQVLPKRFTFLIDHSGSMKGQKLDQAREAAIYCVERLNGDDLLNVIRFDGSPTLWSTLHKVATPERITSAVAFLNDTKSRGGTDIMGALTTALAGMRNDAYVNVIIFLTDGQANVDHKKLLELNTTGTRIFVFGVGDNVASSVLTQIATDHNGNATYVTDISQTRSSVASLFEKIKDPLIKNPTVSVSPDVLYDIYPGVIPDIYAGEQLVLVGRYTTPGEVTVSVNGADVHGNTTHQFAATLSDNQDINTFVAKIWASFRIKTLLEWMGAESSGSSLWKEWRDEIIRLGQRYGIVTPFTSYVDAGEEDGSSGGTSSETGGDVTSVIEHDELNIARDLCRIAPNPVVNHTAITLNLSEVDRSNVRVEIVDLRGTTIAILFDESSAPEHLVLEWGAVDSFGMPVARGQYLLVVTIDGLRSSTPITVVH